MKLFIYLLLISLLLVGCRTTTIYTPQDMYYLKWTHLTSESGNVDRQFEHRSKALAYLEQRTADDCNALLGDLYIEYDDYGQVNQIYASKTFADYLYVSPLIPENWAHVLVPILTCR